MPYLNMCELSSEKDMKQLLSRFYHELKDQNPSCFDDFYVEWNQISIKEPRSDLAKCILQKMCNPAAEGLRIQHGHGYGFFGEQFNERTSIVSEMSDGDLNLIPSHNLDCERDLAGLSIHIENTSKYSNLYFKARCSRDNIMLHKFSQVKRIKRDIKEVLDKHEQEWYDQQSLRRIKLKNWLKEGNIVIIISTRLLQNLSHGVVLSHVLMTLF